MLAPRIIPVLLLSEGGLVKTRQFAKPIYVGDPVNAVRIFNDKEVDELIFLDISAGKKRIDPNFELIYEIASEAFIPFAYGGGISNLQQIEKLFSIGAEKVVLNTITYTNPEVVEAAVRRFGAQSIVASIDVGKSLFGAPQIKSHGGLKKQNLSISEQVNNLMQLGVGEIMINSINRDGMMSGYDLDLVKMVSEMVNIPIIASGGAGSLAQMRDVLRIGKADAAAAGSFFVFKGSHRGVLINYPTRSDLKILFENE